MLAEILYRRGFVHIHIHTCFPTYVRDASQSLYRDGFMRPPYRGNVQRPRVFGGLYKTLNRGGFAKSLGVRYTHAFPHIHILVFFPTGSGGVLQSTWMQDTSGRPHFLLEVHKDWFGKHDCFVQIWIFNLIPNKKLVFLKLIPIPPKGVGLANINVLCRYAYFLQFQARGFAKHPSRGIHKAFS